MGPLCMVEMHTLQVILSEDLLVQIEDEFVDKEDDLRHLVFDPIKTVSKQTAMIKSQKKFVANIMDDDQERSQKTVKLEDVDLDKYDLKSDPDWLPENITKEDVKPYKIRVGKKTWDYLLFYFKIYSAKIDLYNETLDRGAKDYEENKAVHAKCWEQIIHEIMIGPVLTRINKAVDKELEEEFKEVYKGKKDKAKEKAEKRNPKK